MPGFEYQLCKGETCAGVSVYTVINRWVQRLIQHTVFIIPNVLRTATQIHTNGSEVLIGRKGRPYNHDVQPSHKSHQQGVIFPLTFGSHFKRILHRHVPLAESPDNVRERNCILQCNVGRYSYNTDIYMEPILHSGSCLCLPLKTTGAPNVYLRAKFGPGLCLRSCMWGVYRLVNLKQEWSLQPP